MRILVIEDELNLQADIRSGLESESYIVDTSADGNEGYFFAAEYPLDAAIVDVCSALLNCPPSLSFAFGQA